MGVVPQGRGQDRWWEGASGQNHADRLHFLELVRLCPKACNLVCRSAVSNPHRPGRGKAGGGRGSPGQEHADWLVTLGDQLGGLQAQMASTASTSNLHALQSQGLLPNFQFWYITTFVHVKVLYMDVWPWACLQATNSFHCNQV